ncbi:MAG: LysM peptidoglycan-binding domain-containing protein [Oscillospiraceae bacterium]|nr:LysM peptidoglycan-binding domain-containing protein [Oscillospiraceae bacterium]
MAEIINDSALEGVAGGASKKSNTYTVKAGDTLTSIAKANGTTWRLLFTLNEETIVSTAKRHGIEVKNYDDYANYIYAGEVLRLH